MNEKKRKQKWLKVNNHHCEAFHIDKEGTKKPIKIKVYKTPSDIYPSGRRIIFDKQVQFTNDDKIEVYEEYRIE